MIVDLNGSTTDITDVFASVNDSVGLRNFGKQFDDTRFTLMRIENNIYTLVPITYWDIKDEPVKYIERV